MCIHDCLIDLNKDLKKIGQSLIIRIGAANNIFENIIKKEHVRSDIERFEMGYIDEIKSLKNE